jgi:hypothetical protein
MTFPSRPSRRATLPVVALMIATFAACSGVAKPNPSALPTTASGGISSTTGNGPACHSTPSGTAGASGGDVLVPGDIPDTQRFVTFHSADGYHIDHPEGWAQLLAGSVVTFTDKFNSIRVVSTATPSAPSVASVQTGELAALAASIPCFQGGKVTSLARKSGSAILTVYRSESSPDPVTGKVVPLDFERYGFWHSGKLVTVTLSSPTGSDNVDPWRKVTDSFGWGS